MSHRDDLHAACERLLRDAGGKKVFVCAADGAVLAHAGDAGALAESVAEAVAQLVGGVLSGSATDALTLTGDVVAAIEGGGDGALSACATPLESRAALLVLFDGGTTLERVRVKIRRVRPLLVSNLPDEKAPSENNPSAS
jgi:hypothetical protein